MSSEDLKILQKAYDMVQYGYTVLRQFPKSERHVLAAEMRSTMVQILRLIIVANRRRQKLPVLHELDVALDLLRLYMRLAKDLGFLPFRQYEHWAKQVNEVGRMVGGWIRAAVASGH
ncbi:MAG: diversity-generating retroelement protein Avd [Firmicutes bacterium]|nr:diversity-generating retroelement protein Avd [Bacillota bacterium]